ncbi:MAG: hypothetical protein ACT4PV_08270 [Planctomycetaceae bacterium]
MRMFLPIKGPGGRLLTPREKVALFVLALTLILSLVTLFAGPRAFLAGTARNPVLAFVSVPSRILGGGVLALYALVLLWSSLIYWKGERAARLDPVSGRVLAAIGAVLGISGALGIARLETAGNVGIAVGSALHNTLGSSLGLTVLFLLVLLGMSLAAQGYWGALRSATAMAAAAPAAPAAVPSLRRNEALWGAAGGRRSTEQELPDDGDPSPEDRTLAVTQGLEEIERSQGVTILEVERETPRSLGEEVAEAPPPPPGCEEDEVQEGLRRVAASLAQPADTLPEAADPAPPGCAAPDAEAVAETPGDPYARPGLLDRLPQHGEEQAPPADAEPRPFSNFDWRGQPLE